MPHLLHLSVSDNNTILCALKASNAYYKDGYPILGKTKAYMSVFTHIISHGLRLLLQRAGRQRERDIYCQPTGPSPLDHRNE